MNMVSKVVFVAIASLSALSANASTPWSTQDYDLYPGDFDGDGKADILYVAKDQTMPSGIAKSDGSAPTVSWQTWPGNYLGIQWYGNAFSIVVADFNHDNKADVLLQSSTGGDSFLLLADANGRLTGISQTITSSYLGLSWSKDQHEILAGDFNGDGRADLFLQAANPAGTNAIVFADANGTFTSGPAQTWTDASWSAFRWSRSNAVMSVGDFNGDGKSDLLIQAKPNQVLIDFDIPIPVPTYKPNSFGVVLSAGGTNPIQQSGVQQWSRYANGVDWSPSSATAVLGDFNGDGRVDVLLQARNSGGLSYLLNGNGNGAAFSLLNSVSANVAINANSARLLAANFDGVGGAGLYIQAQTSSGSNSSVNTVGASISATAHNASSILSWAPVTAVGRTAGSFGVGQQGAASYRIPIQVPPGIKGVQPNLALVYSSQSGNGWLGVGWTLSGLSKITRCPATFEQEGFSRPVSLTINDKFCLDGNKLRITNSPTYSYGQAGSTYETELQNFSETKAFGSAGTINGTLSAGPAYFVVRRKDGLDYEYGNTEDSRIEAILTSAHPNSASTPHTWLLNKVSDRAGNTMTITYQEDGSPNGGYRPLEIKYTSNSIAGVVAAFRVNFIWESRSPGDYITEYKVGEMIRETYRLDRIETSYNNALVKKYDLTYQSSAVGRSKLSNIQECSGTGVCLAPTVFTWQEGINSWSPEASVSLAGLDATAAMYSHSIDFDGDGRTDLVFPGTSGSNRTWAVALSNGTGFNAITQYDGAGSSQELARALQIQRSASGGAIGLLLDTPLRLSYPTNSTSITHYARPIFSSFGAQMPASSNPNPAALSDGYWSGDFDGDGRTDILRSVPANGVDRFYIQKGDELLRFSPESVFHTSTTQGAYNPLGAIQNGGLAKPLDFNGDGKTDIVVERNAPIQYCVDGGQLGQVCQSSDYFTWEVLTSTGAGFVSVATGTSGGCSPYPDGTGGTNCARTPPFAGDFNGDGLTDLVVNSQIRFGSATGLSPPINIALPAAGIEALVGDLNGDGRAEFLFRAPGSVDPSWYLAQWNGANFDIAATALIPIDASSPRLFDLNGDGLAEVGYFRNGAFKLRLHDGPIPDVLSQIQDGLGNQIDVTYAAASDTSVYTPSTTQPLYGNEVNIVPAKILVKDYKSKDSTGTPVIFSEHYGSARQHGGGRGFLGFRFRDETDSRTLTTHHWDFLQTPQGVETMSFPFTGLVAREWITQTDGKTVSDTVYNYQRLQSGLSYDDFVLNPPTGQYVINSRDFPFAQEITTTVYEVSGELNGMPVTETKTTIENIDQYGNPVVVRTVSKDLQSNSPWLNQSVTNLVENTISNMPDSWCLGRASKTEITSILLDGTSRKNTVKRSIDYDKCRTTSETTEPDVDGNPTALSVVTAFTFDPSACGNPSAITVTGYKKSSSGGPIQLLPRTTTLGYGPACSAPISIDDPNGQRTTRTYDYAFGVVTTEKDPNHQVGANQQIKQWTYDSLGRPISTIDLDGTSTTTTLVACNSSNGYCGVSDLRMRVDTIHRDANANPITTSYSYLDSLGRIRVQSSPLPLSGELSNVVTTYDALGRIATRSAPYTSGVPATTVFAYDLAGRQLSAKLYNGSILIRTMSASYQGRFQTSTDARTYSTEKVFDIAGQLRKVKDPTSALYTNYGYTYVGSDLVATVTDKLGNVMVTKTNLVGQKIVSQDPDLGVWSYEYDSLGELTKQTDAKTQTTSFDDYDKLGRPTVRHEVEGDTYFEYGSTSEYAYGQLKRISRAGYSEEYVFDSLGRPQTTKIQIPAEPRYDIDYSYDPTSGFLDTVTYPLSTSSTRLRVKYGYTRGVQTSVRDYTNGVSGTIYWQLAGTDAQGHATNELLGNNVRVLTGYDPVTGTMGSRQAGTDVATTNVQNLSYLWDANGNLERRTDMKQSSLYERFEYDELNRLKDSYRVDGSGTTNNLHLTYDEIGNILTKSGVGTYAYPTPGASSIRPHAVTSVTLGTTVSNYSYDANGNMSTRPGASVDWYSDNTVKKITQGGVSSEFWNSPTGQRYKQYAVFSTGTETSYYVGGLMEKVVLSPTSSVFRHYISAGSSTVVVSRWNNGTNETRYVSTDHLGSSSAITNENGVVLLTESFDAFGKRRGSNWSGSPSSADMQAIANVSRDGYTGHEHLDNLGLIHMNGRVQDPVLGRFLSADPVIQAPEFSQSLNRYSYVWNNPLSMTDPSGFEGRPECPNGSHWGGELCNPNGSICDTNVSCDSSWIWGEGPTMSMGQFLDFDFSRGLYANSLFASNNPVLAPVIVERRHHRPYPTLEDVRVLTENVASIWGVMRSEFPGADAPGNKMILDIVDPVPSVLAAVDEALDERFGSAIAMAILTAFPEGKFANPRGTTLLLKGPRMMMDHHLFPQQFRSFFGKLGIDIDQHTVTMGDLTHLKGIHGKGLGNMPGRWNSQWSDWISKNPSATSKDVYQQLGKMMDQYHINDLPIHPYGE